MQGRGKKENNNKNWKNNEDFQKGKKIGRPKQRWVEATVNGAPIPAGATFSELEELITEATIHGYVSAHWEKVK